MGSNGRTRPVMVRRMADSTYRQAQEAGIFEPHIGPINRLVDELRAEAHEFVPYLAPTYGGVNARVLTIFRDPGPKTQQGKGSGMLSVENDDASAERFLSLYNDAGMKVSELISWNAYPWYINRKPTSSEVDRGLDALKRLLGLLPKLELVIAHGRDAQGAWQRFRHRHPLMTRDLTTIETYHTSRQALWTPDASERDRRNQDLETKYAQAATILGSR